MKPKKKLFSEKFTLVLPLNGNPIVNYQVNVKPGGNIFQNFSEIIFDFLSFQFSEKFWEIFQISSESFRLSPKIPE